MPIVSNDRAPLTRDWSPLQSVLKKQGLKCFGFLKKYYPILWKIESNCGRWVKEKAGQDPVR
jgi:hypothetical protein